MKQESLVLAFSNINSKRLDYFNEEQGLMRDEALQQVVSQNFLRTIKRNNLNYNTLSNLLGSDMEFIIGYILI